MSEKEINYKLVEEVAKVWGTISECAAVLGVNQSTVTRRLKNDPLFKEAWDRGLELCKLDLRRTLFKQSKGFGPQAVTAAIHLSKHILGMTEKSLVEHTGTVTHEFVGQRASDLLTQGFTGHGLTAQEAGELQDLCEALDVAGSLPALDAPTRDRLMALLAKGAAGDTGVIDGEFTEVKPQLPAPEQQEKDDSNACGIVDAE